MNKYCVTNDFIICSTLLNIKYVIIGNVDLLDHSPRTLQKKFICGDHFTNDDYCGTSLRLRKGALPMHFEPSSSSGSSVDSPIPPQRTYPGASSNRLSPQPGPSNVLHETDETNDGWDQTFETISSFPSKKRKRTKSPSAIRYLKLQKVCSRQMLENKRLRSQLFRAKTKFNLRNNIPDILQSLTFPSTDSKLLCAMQLRNKKAPWTKEEKQFSCSFYFNSPAGYKYFKRSNIVLPALSTIKRWNNKSSFLPGFNKLIFKQLKCKGQEMEPHEKLVLVCFDEMSIQEKLEFNDALDVIEGVEDLGSWGRTKQHAKKALVIMARGLISSWKLQLGYFLTKTGVSKEIMHEILVYTIKELKKTGFLPKLVVCDQSSINVALLKHIGVTVDRPSVEIENNSVFFMYDTPHLIKNIRNNLLNGNYILKNGETVKFSIIEQAYNIDKSARLARYMPKLTDNHLYPGPFQKMSCFLAFQVLSNTVWAAISNYISKKLITDESACATADFIKAVNDLLDVLNSKFPKHYNPLKCAFINSIHQAHILENAKEIFSNIRKISHKPDKKISRPPVFDGILLTINSLILLYEHLKTFDYTKDQDFLTYRLNQDCLEFFFSVIRRKGGCNTNPSARSFRTIFRSCALNGLTPSEFSNCENDNDEFLPL